MQLAGSYQGVLTAATMPKVTCDEANDFRALRKRRIIVPFFSCVLRSATGRGMMPVPVIMCIVQQALLYP